MKNQDSKESLSSKKGTIAEREAEIQESSNLPNDLVEIITDYDYISASPRTNITAISAESLEATKEAQRFTI